VDADLTGADLTGCHIYGISAWGLKLKGAKQQNLVITHVRHDVDEPTVTVDNIEVAQFVTSCFTTKRFATPSTPSGGRPC